MSNHLSSITAIAISLGIASPFIFSPAYAQFAPPPPAVTPAPAPTPTPIPVAAPVTVQAPVETPRTPQVTLPTFTGNPILTPADQNIGNTSISLANRMNGALPGPNGLPILPPFLQHLSALASNNLQVEEIPLNATIINTSDATDCDHLVPIGMCTVLSQSLPLSGSITNTGPIVVRVNDKRTHFFVCTDEGRLIQGDSTGAKEGLIAGAAGTVFSCNQGVLTLHSGRALIQTKHEPIRIATRVGGAKIGQNSTVLIDYSTDKMFTIAVLSAGEKEAIKVRSAFAPDTIMTLNDGQQLVASESRLSEQPDSESLAGNRVVKSKFNPSEIQAALDDLTTPSLIGTKAAQRFTASVKKYYQVQPLSSATNEHKPALRLLTCDGTAFSASKSGEIHIYYGHVFLSLPQNMIVSTNLGDVHCHAGATVNIARLPGHARIQLFDTPATAVISCGSTTAVLDKGQEVLLSDHYPVQSEALPADGVGRRQFVLNKMDNNITAVLSDFQVFGSIKNSTNLEALRHPTTEADRILCDELLKFTAALQFATADRGNYYFPPKAAIGSSQ